MVSVPFRGTRLFQRVGDRPLPASAADFDAATRKRMAEFVDALPAVSR